LTAFCQNVHIILRQTASAKRLILAGRNFGRFFCPARLVTLRHCPVNASSLEKGSPPPCALCQDSVSSVYLGASQASKEPTRSKAFRFFDPFSSKVCHYLPIYLLSALKYAAVGRKVENRVAGSFTVLWSVCGVGFPRVADPLDRPDMTGVTLLGFGG
jgi:hypothetical protein